MAYWATKCSSNILAMRHGSWARVSDSRDTRLERRREECEKEMSMSYLGESALWLMLADFQKRGVLRGPGRALMNNGAEKDLGPRWRCM